MSTFQLEEARRELYRITQQAQPLVIEIWKELDELTEKARPFVDEIAKIVSQMTKAAEQHPTEAMYGPPEEHAQSAYQEEPGQVRRLCGLCQTHHTWEGFGATISQMVINLAKLEKINKTQTSYKGGKNGAQKKRIQGLPQDKKIQKKRMGDLCLCRTIGKLKHGRVNLDGGISPRYHGQSGFGVAHVRNELFQMHAVQSGQQNKALGLEQAFGREAGFSGGPTVASPVASLNVPTGIEAAPGGGTVIPETGHVNECASPMRGVADDASMGTSLAGLLTMIGDLALCETSTSVRADLKQKTEDLAQRIPGTERESQIYRGDRHVTTGKALETPQNPCNSARGSSPPHRDGTLLTASELRGLGLSTKAGTLTSTFVTPRAKRPAQEASAVSTATDGGLPINHGLKRRGSAGDSVEPDLKKKKLDGRMQ